MQTTAMQIDVRRLREYRQLMDPLPEIIDDVLLAWPVGVCYVTSIHRTPSENPEGATQIHVVGPPYRAVDFGTLNIDADADDRWQDVIQVASRVNALWVYDPNRPNLKVCVDKIHGTAPHLHVQVHPSTRAR